MNQKMDNEIQGKSLVPVIENESKRESVAYSEHSWWNDGQFDDAQEFKEKFYSGGKILDYEALHRRKSVRTPEYRYVELGEDKIEDANTHEEFVRSLYRKIRSDWDTNYEERITETVEKLQEGELNREEVKQRFFNDSLLHNKYALFNIRRDPAEEVNLLLINEGKYKSTVDELREDMERITSEKTEEVYSPENNEEIESEEVIENLENLGYL